MNLTDGVAPYSYFGVVVFGFVVFVSLSAFFVWVGFIFERKKERDFEETAKRGRGYESFEVADYGMFVFMTVAFTFIACIPVGAITSTSWYENESTSAALVREADRVYDIALDLTEAAALLDGGVVEVGDDFLKLDDDILTRVDSFSPLD